MITFLNIASVRTCAIIMHWFLLAEGFVIAQVMWMASVRYRHACTHALRLCSCGRSEEYDGKETGILYIRAVLRKEVKETYDLGINPLTSVRVRVRVRNQVQG